MAYTPTVNRIPGMASGMDTEAMVRAMTMSQQSKIDSLLRKKTLAEWKATAITENNNMLRTFKDDFISVLGSKSLMKADAYNSMSVKSTNNAVSVSAAAGAKAGLHKIAVTQLALGARASGDKFAKEGYTLNTSATLKTLLGSEARATEGNIATVHLLDANGNPMYGGENGDEPVMGFRFTINDKDFQFSENTKLSDVISTINNSKAGVKLSYTQLSNQFTLESTKTGVNSTLEVNETDSEFFRFLGLTNVFGGVQEGQNAKVKIDGFDYENANNNFTIDGMTFTLNSETKIDPATGEHEAAEFVIERDVSKSVDLVKSFVDALNELMGKIDAAVRQKKDPKYSPLTDMLKEGMTEKEIEDWEAKAKEGLLYRDNKLNTLMNSLQRALTDSVGGSTLREIGISFGKYTVGAAPKLELDVDKLTKALEADPDKVYGIMAKAANETEKDPGGLLARVGAAIDKYTADTKERDIQNLRENVNDYVKRINDQEDKLYLMQERLYVKFAAFEKAMAQMQSQTDKIAAYFG